MIRRVGMEAFQIRRLDELSGGELQKVMLARALVQQPKGNLLFHMRGKQAFSFYNRANGKSVRLVLKPRPAGMTKDESFQYYQACSPEEMFEVKKTTILLPERARLFDSYSCECCGEETGANWIRIAGGRKLCLDCYQVYDRFNV